MTETYFDYLKNVTTMSLFSLFPSSFLVIIISAICTKFEFSEIYLKFLCE